MSDAQVLLCGLAGAALALAIFAGWRDHRRRHRADPDAVGWIDWTWVQAIALIAAGIAGWLALKA